MDKKLVSVADAAVLMSVSRAFLYPKIMSGEIRSIKIGKKARRIPIEAIDEYVARELARQSEGTTGQSDLS